MEVPNSLLCYPNYLPIPPRAWSRVDLSCVYDNTLNTPNISAATPVYIPFLQKTVPYVDIAHQLQMYNKGNVLQYKKNSSNLTKRQRYAQIAKGMWTNRTKTWATQGETYANPNTHSLQHVNYNTVQLSTGIPTTLPISCQIPMNPTQYAIPLAENQPILPSSENIVIPDGGGLICGTFQNLCNGLLLTQPAGSNCVSTSASDVPGQEILLCWNDGNPTWYPRNQLTQNSSGGNKFPVNYKGLVSAVHP